MAMAGFPYHFPCPKVLGVKLTGALSDWVSAKDVILEMLRRYGVKGCIGKVVEYYGPGVKSLSATDRETIGNMGTELGATTSIFPSDENTRAYAGSSGAGRLLDAPRFRRRRALRRIRRNGPGSHRAPHRTPLLAGERRSRPGRGGDQSRPGHHREQCELFVPGSPCGRSDHGGEALSPGGLLQHQPGQPPGLEECGGGGRVPEPSFGGSAHPRTRLLGMHRDGGRRPAPAR